MRPHNIDSAHCFFLLLVSMPRSQAEEFVCRPSVSQGMCVVSSGLPARPGRASKRKITCCTCSTGVVSRCVRVVCGQAEQCIFMHGHMRECECVCPRTHGEVMRVYAKYLWGIFQNVNREIVRNGRCGQRRRRQRRVCARMRSHISARTND